jgi:hypothetical protein
VAIRARVPGEAGAAAPLIEEELLLDGAQVAATATARR